MYNLPLETSRELILKAENYAELRKLRDQVHEIMQMHPLFANSVKWNLMLNEAHDWLIQRSIALSEKIMEEAGMGLPPVPYAFVLFGSGGRKEQTLWSDQDNGMIYGFTDAGNAEQAADYFANLANHIVEGLKVLGYPPCDGEVICSNVSWRKSILDWKLMLQIWLDEANWEPIRYLLIVEDMRAVYGETSLVDKLKQFLGQHVNEHRPHLENLLQNTLHRKASLGVFGQILTERYGEDSGGVDIKYGSYIPIVNGIRLLAIQAGIMETSTLERIDKLLEYKRVSETLANDWKRAFALNLELRSKTPFQLDEGLYSSRGKISTKLLTKETRQELKFSLHVGIDLQKYVQKKILDELQT